MLLGSSAVISSVTVTPVYLILLALNMSNVSAPTISDLKYLGAVVLVVSWVSAVVALVIGTTIYWILRCLGISKTIILCMAGPIIAIVIGSYFDPRNINFHWAFYPVLGFTVSIVFIWLEGRSNNNVKADAPQSGALFM